MIYGHETKDNDGPYRIREPWDKSGPASLELLYLFSQRLDSVANVTGHKQRNDRQHERGQHLSAADRCGERFYELVSRLERDDDETEMV